MLLVYLKLMMPNKITVILLVVFYFLLSIKCGEHPSVDRHPEYFDFYLKKADTIKSDRKEEAIFSLDSALRAFPDPAKGDIFSVDSMKCVLYGFPIKNYATALSYADSMFLVDNGQFDTEAAAERTTWALFAKAYCYRLMTQYNEALNYFFAGQQLGLRYVRNKCHLEKFEGGIGYLLFAQGKYQLAAAHFLKQHSNISQSCNLNDFIDDFRLSYNDATVSYLMAGMLDSAWFYANETLKILDEQERKFPQRLPYFEYAKCVIYSCQADVINERGKDSSVEDLYKKSIEGTKTLDFIFARRKELSLAKYYLKKGEIKKFGDLMTDIKSSLDTLPENGFFEKWLSVKAGYFAGIKNHDSAFYFQRLYNEIKDSIDINNKNFATHDIGNEYENLELKYFNESLQKEASLKNLYLIISIIVFVTVASVAMIVWFSFKKMTKLNFQVQQKNKELESAFIDLEQSHAENTRIMRVVAHDLRDSINTIQHVIHSLLHEEKLESQREMFSSIQSCCTDSISFIKDFMDDRNSRKNDQEITEIGVLLQNCVQLLQAKADEKKQQLTLKLVHLEMMMNRQKIWRVMSNIINNAIKFSPLKSVINIVLEKKEDHVLFSVTDHGIGIPANLKNKIFEISDDAVRPGTEGEKSYGLGLSISKKIVEEHNGKMWFESEEGKGSVFFVDIPVV
jgi:signal transduction histidine kinase